MNNIANRQVICDILCNAAKTDEEIVVLCSDSRGSASLAPFAAAHPKQFVETGIAEQNLVSIAAGLAKCGKKTYAASPACFLTSRSLEQVKIDVAYSNTNVKLIGISGGVSYGALGMSHHSAQDIAAVSSIPNMRVYLPSDRLQTAALMKHLLQDQQPAYIRVGRNPVEDVYEEGNMPFVMNRANVLPCAAGAEAKVVIVACGEMVHPSVEAMKLLGEKEIAAKVIDMYCVKPFDKDTLLKESEQAELIVTVEEHSMYGGLGSMVSQAVSQYSPKKVISLALPDSPVVSGTSKEVFGYYGLNKEGIVKTVFDALGR